MELMCLQMSSIDSRMTELRSGLGKWGRQAGKKLAQGLDEQATLAHMTASDSFAQLEVRPPTRTLKLPYVHIASSGCSNATCRVCGCLIHDWQAASGHLMITV